VIWYCVLPSMAKWRAIFNCRCFTVFPYKWLLPELCSQVSGALREQGILSAIFPGSVAESYGKAKFQLTAGGTWAKPYFGGLATLIEAGAYLPQILIRLVNAGSQAG
jgi:hypothetical protein